MLNRYKTEDFLTCYIPGKPEVVKGKTDTFSLNVELSFNEKLYKEAFIPDLIQVLDQVASVKKNTLLVKYKNDLRNLAAKKGLSKIPACESIILRANDFGDDYTLAIYNKPENFGCRLYGFKADEISKIDEVLAKFCQQTKRVNGVVLELLDGDKEVIETIEKKFDVAFLTTYKLQNDKNVYSVQPTILTKSLSENYQIPDNVTLKRNSDGTVTIALAPFEVTADRHIANHRVTNSNKENFPFIITLLVLRPKN